MTPREMVLHVLSENVEGLEFNTLLSRCNYVGHKDAFQSLLRNLVKAGNIFAWKGKFHHGKYRGEKVKERKRRADDKSRLAKKALSESVKKVNKNFDVKMAVLDDLISVVSKEKRLALIQIKTNLEFVSNASI